MNNSKAIVTLAIGKKYLNRWEKLCKKNWKQYGDKHGYDIICIDAPLDNSERAQKRSPSWQKCLILSQNFLKKYERIVWVDADILINSSKAPCIVKDVPVEKIGAVDAFLFSTPQWVAECINRAIELRKKNGIPITIGLTQKEYYTRYGLSPAFDMIVQAGVMVLSNHHRKVFEKVYNSNEEKGGPEWGYEMLPLSHELIKANCIHWIDHRFNVVWLAYKYLNYPFLLKISEKKSLKQDSLTIKKLCVTCAFSNSYFLHLGGSLLDNEMELVDTEVASWTDIPKSIKI